MLMLKSTRHEWLSDHAPGGPGRAPQRPHVEPNPAHVEGARPLRPAGRGRLQGARARLLGLVEVTQKLLEDQARERKRGWRRLR